MSSRNPSGDLFSLMAPPMGPMPRGLGVSIAPGAIPVAAHTPRTDRHAQVRREYDVMEGDGNTRRIIVRTKREIWALDELMKAGAFGCTPIDNPGPRWSGYVYKLKRNHGLSIQTVNEAHGGPFKGTHGRYVLRSTVRAVESEAA